MRLAFATGKFPVACREFALRTFRQQYTAVPMGDDADSDIDAIRQFASSRSFDTVYFPGISGADANRFNLLDRPWLYDGVQALLGDGADRFFADYKYFI